MSIKHSLFPFFLIQISGSENTNIMAKFRNVFTLQYHSAPTYVSHFFIVQKT
jgi:hypothetical protein